MPSPLTVDMHAHIVPRECIPLEFTDGAGNVSGIRFDDDSRSLLLDGQRVRNTAPERLYDVDLRLREMDRQRIDVEALSVPPYMFLYPADPASGMRFARRLNDGIAAIARAHPDRFVALATVPMQSVPDAIAELERAVGELGMRGVEICTNINGLNLDEEQYLPFFEKVQELDVPITFHPTRVAGADRLRSYYLQNLIGNPVDNTIAIASLIFGGVLARLPRLRPVFFHGGGTAPYIRGRWRHGYEVRDEPKQHINRSPEAYFDRLYFDTITHGLPALQFLVDTVGADRVMIGTDFPFDMGDYESVEHVEALTGISRAERRQILGGTAAGLLEL